MLKGNRNTPIPRDLLPYLSPLRCTSSPAKLFEAVSYILQKLYYKLSPSLLLFSLQCFSALEITRSQIQYASCFTCFFHVLYIFKYTTTSLHLSHCPRTVFAAPLHSALGQEGKSTLKYISE